MLLLPQRGVDGPGLSRPITNPPSEDHADGKAEGGCQGEDPAEVERPFPWVVSISVGLRISRRNSRPESRQRQRHRHDPPPSDGRADGERDEGGGEDLEHANTYTGTLRQ